MLEVSMGLRPTHLGYAYQDLLTALRLVDLAVGRTTSVLVDTKLFTGDRFDDITCDWGTGSRERLQVKHTDHDRALSLESFTKDNRGLRLDLLVSSMEHDLTSHPGVSHRLVVRDTEPEDPELTRVLRPVHTNADPGPALHGLTSKRFRFDAAALRAHAPWKDMLAEVDDDLLSHACACLVVDTNLPACSLSIYAPGPAEEALLHRITEELGAGRPPNRHRTPEDVALALIETAKAARSQRGTVTIEELLPRLSLEVDFGAVREGHPVDHATEVHRPTVLTGVLAAVKDAAQQGGVVVVTGAPGIGKSWLCEQLGEALRETWLAVRHHCWLGAADSDRDQRVLSDVVIGSLLKQLEVAAPEALAQVRPRYAATPETLTAAVTALRGLAADRPIALIVDGIDHVSRVLGYTAGSAFRGQSDPAAQLVADLTALQLPPGVVLVLASQPGPHLDAVDGGASRVTVAPLNRGELHALAERLGVLAALASSPVGEGLDAAARAQTAVALIEERSRGNALYATYLCRQAVGPLPGLGAAPAPDGSGDPLERLRTIPSSAHDLDDYYAYLLAGLSPGQRSAVSMLAVCDFAVTARELEEIFPLPGLQVGAALSNVAPIIAQQPGIGGLKIHHESFSRFIRRVDGDEGWVDQVRSQAADWLSRRGFFTDPRAFRHLPELLAALGRDDELALLIGPDFLTRAIAGLQPPQAVVHTLAVAARRAAVRRDWPTLVRCIELSRARANYEDEGLPASLVPYADVLVELVGADRLAASLMYEGVPTMPARWGLQLCAAVDRAGYGAPWEAYLTAWDDARDDEQVHYGAQSDESVALAELRGRIRLPARAGDDVEAGQAPRTLAQRVARFLDQEALTSPGPALDVLLDCLGFVPLLDSAEHIERPDRRTALLLHLADTRSSADSTLPSARMLATAAWASGPCDPRRLLRHGLAATDLAEEIFAHDIWPVLTEATHEVLTDRPGGLSGPVSRWLALLAVAHATDPQAPARLLQQLGGEGFYRAWLRFALATLGLRQDVEAGKLPASTASAVARVALEQLAQHTAPFTGRPSVGDLIDIYQLVREVLHDAVALLHGDDVALGIAALQAVSEGTTLSLMGMAGTGPLITTDLLSLLAASVGQAGVDVARELMRTLRAAHAGYRALYPESADFELEMARVSLACGDPQEARQCWDRAARYMGAYGSHKDITIEELLDPLPRLMQADPVQARVRLARAQPLVYLVAHSTDGRSTSGFPSRWWQLLARLDPRAAAEVGAQVLLTEPGLPDHRVAAAHRELLAAQANTADPVILAALRLAAGNAGRHITADIAVLGRLADLPADDAARSMRLLPVLANAITSTYDDQALSAAPHAKKNEPAAALTAAAHRCGGEGGPHFEPEPAPVKTSRDWSSRRHPTTQAYLHAQQRPMLPRGAAGVLAAVRDRSSKAYSDPQGPRWSRDALANAVGWRMLEVLRDQGADAVTQLLHRIPDEMNLSNPLELLADIAAGLRLRHDIDPDVFGPLAATAGMLAYTKTRGGGGWRAFAGSDRLDLWRQAHAVDATTASRVLADQVAQAAANPAYSRATGVSQALVSAFAIQSPDPSQHSPVSALACWDAAFDVIAHRLPGDTGLGHHSYQPEPEPAVQGDIDTALCRLVLATVALPERGDKRRALIAATALLASRPAQAQAAFTHVLSFDLGAGPLTWLLTVLRSHLPAGPLDVDLRARLETLCASGMLSVRVEAAAVLARAGCQPPSPPATAAHPTLARAIAAALADTEDSA
ncbi:ATP-binding protein [Streptomyces sp. NPDC001910]|uniref:ATP-binding protein n=1 Tax=Streptomyces sp. NPDC001910 TaxID=3154403 RepID=UPI0033335601